MTSATPRPCPRCQQVFQPVRRNQLYCSSQCRIDANNDKAQENYATYRREAPQTATIRQQLAELRRYLKKQIVVAQNIEQLDDKTIRWQGVTYYHHSVTEIQHYGILLQEAGGIYIVQQDELIYRLRVSYITRVAGIYRRTKPE